MYHLKKNIQCNLEVIGIIRNDITRTVYRMVQILIMINMRCMKVIYLHSHMIKVKSTVCCNEIIFKISSDDTNLPEIVHCIIILKSFNTNNFCFVCN